MAAGQTEIRIEMSAEGADAIINALRNVESAGRRAGNGLNDAGNTGRRSFNVASGAARGLNSILNTTANLSTGLFTGIMAGGMVLGSAFGVARGAVDGLKSSLESLREIAIEAANDVRVYETLVSALQIEGPNASAEAQGILSAIAGLGYEADINGTVDMLTTLQSKLREAAGGNEDAAKAFNDLGISMESVVNIRTGELMKPVDLLLKVIEAGGSVDKALRNNALERLIGGGAVKQFAPLFESLPEDIRKSAEELAILGNISADVLDAANKVTTSQQRVAVAISGVGNALLAGMGDSIRDADEEFVKFLVSNQDRVQEFGGLIGEFGEGIYGRLMEFADAVADDMAGTGGDLANGPIKTGMDAISRAIDFVLDRLEEVSAYVGQGESTEWIDSLVEKFKEVLDAVKSFGGGALEFAKFIKDDVAPAVRGLYEAMTSLYEFFGVESAGAQIGITAALVLFGGTIVSTTASIGVMIASATGLSAALAAAAGVAAPFLALLAAPSVGGILGLNEGEALRSYEQLYSAVPKLAEKYGEEAAAAFALAGEKTIGDKNDSWSAWLTGKLGLTDSKEDRVIDLQARLSDASREDVLRDLAELARNEGVKILDDLEFDIGAGVMITGAEINSEIQAQLASIPATIEVTAIEGLQEQIEASLGGTSRLASSSAVGGVATTGSLSPTTIEFNGQPVGQVFASQDQIAEMRKAQARMTRGR